MSTECDYPLGAEAKDMIEDEWAVSQVCAVETRGGGGACSFGMLAWP